METVWLKLVTIIAETVLAETLTEEVIQLGATGYTKTDVQGKGSQQRHAGDIPGHGLKIETVVSPAVADRILQHMAQKYFQDYSLIAYVTDVSVIRGGKYVGS